MTSTRKKLQASRHKIKNLHTRDRRGLYVTPSERDVKCPHYDHKWVKLANTGYGNDMAAVCHNPDANCDYKEAYVPGVLNLCRRYWKLDDQNFQQITTGLPQLPEDRQAVKLNYDLIRLFRDKAATVRMQVAKGVLRYVNLLTPQYLSNFEPWSPTGQASNWSAQSTSISCDTNHGHKSGMVLRGLDDEYQYQMSTYVNPGNSDDDTIGVVFRYNRSTKNYYSLEWNNGGLSPQGLSVKKNIYNPSTGAYIETILYSAPSYRWSPNKNNVISIQVYKDIIHVQVRDVKAYYQPAQHASGNGYGYWIPAHWYEKPLNFTLPLTDSRLDLGTYGLMTQSQVATFTYFAGHAYVEDTVTSISKQIEIDLVDYVGGNYILSDDMETLFQPERDAFLAANNVNREDLLRETYQVVSSNVSEPIEFNNRLTLATNASNKLSMRTWDYDIPIPYVKVIDITHHTPRTITDDYSIIKDIYVRSVSVEFEKIQIEDFFTLEVGGQLIYDKIVLLKRWSTDFDPYVNATATFNVVFKYMVNDSPINFYWRHEHIDTHDKIFNIKDNKLEWHVSPSRE